MSKNIDGGISHVLKGVIFSLILAIIGILVLALLDKLFKFNSMTIKLINQFIKTTAIFIGVMCHIKNERGLVKGLAVGLLFGIILYTIFSIILGDIKFSRILIDCLFSGVIGMISGIISVNLTKKSAI